ncbi:MAG: hypothetical protein ABI874_12535 [Chloroflexota bacterium]
MINTLRHRGPDGEGYHVDGQVGIGHRRLSIIDLSTGDQPMCNEDGTVWITYNGEVYNYLELRRELADRGHHFRTNSDTEVVIHAYEEYGVDCVRRFNGMFAFAIDDGRTRMATRRPRSKPSSRTSFARASARGSALRRARVAPRRSSGWACTICALRDCGERWGRRGLNDMCGREDG